MSQSQDAQECPAISMDTSEIVGLSADVIFAKINRKKSNDVRMVIEILCHSRRTMRELIFLLQQRDPAFGSFPNHAELIWYLDGSILRRYKETFTCYYGEWFTKGSKTDPEVQEIEQSRAMAAEELNGADLVEVFEDRHALRRVVFDILSHESLVLGQLRLKVRKDPRYDSTSISERDLGLRIFRVLADNPKVFEKRTDVSGVIPKLYARWGNIDGATINSVVVLASQAPKQRRVKAPQRDALCMIMSKKWRIRGWSLDELMQAVLQQGSGYKIKPDRTPAQLRDALSHHLCSPHENRFEQIGSNHDDPWRVKALKVLKKPKTPDDWDSILLDISSEEIPWNFNALCAYIKVHGPYYGWDTTVLAQSFFENHIALAIQRASLT